MDRVYIRKKSGRDTTRWVVAVFLVAHLPTVVLGQINYGIHVLSIEDGLSQVMINCILQDRRGFMWFGTKDGLNRFDGYSFKIYKPDPDDPYSVSDNFILALHEDTSGRIWVGTWGGGLDVFDPATDRFSHYRHNPADTNSLSNNDVTAIHGDRVGNLWIGTMEGGLNKLHMDTGRFQRFQQDPGEAESISHNYVSSIKEDTRGRLWIGTFGGLDLLDPKTGEMSHYGADPQAENSLDHLEVQAVYIDAAGVIWVGTSRGLNRLDPVSGIVRSVRFRKEFQDQVADPVRTIYGKEGRLWVGGLSGLYAIDPGRHEEEHDPTEQINPYGPLRTVISIYEDRAGLLWFGTSGFGVATLDTRRPFQKHQQFPGVPNSLSGAHVYGIKETESGLLCMGTNNGFDAWNPKTGQMLHLTYDPANPRGLSNPWVFSIQESRGVLWLATRRGLDYVETEKLAEGVVSHYLHDATDSKSLSHNHLSLVYVGNDAEDNTLWIGTKVGLDALDRETGTFRHFFHKPDDPNSLSHNEVRVMLESRQPGKKRFWIGTEGGGLDLFDPESESFTQFPIGGANGLSHGRVISLLEQEGNLLWIGTRGGGLNRLDLETGRFRHFREKDGLPNDTVYGILADEAGYLWLSTNKGLARFDPREQTFKGYREQDGIQGNEFNSGAYYKDKKNRLLFGGTNGLTLFTPEEILDNPHKPQIVLTDFLLPNEPEISNRADSPLRQTITETDKIILTHRQNMFSLHFAALDFASPDDNRYLYKMVGFNKSWLRAPVENRLATFTNLDAGDYTFRVKACNRDGVWNEEGISLKVVVLPSPLRTVWAYMLYGLALSGLVVGYLRYQERIKNILESTVVERTGELRDKNEELLATQKRLVDAAHTAGMAEIATEVLHHLGNSLNSVQTSVHLIEERLAGTQGIALLKRTHLLLKEEDPDLPALVPGLERISRLLENQIKGSAGETEQLAIHVKNMVTVLREQHQYSAGMGWLLEPVDVNNFIRQAVDNEKGNLREGRVEVTLDLSNLPLVIAEKFKFQRVLGHLIRNAREAVAPTRAHSTEVANRFGMAVGRITVTTTVQSEEVVVEITDNGLGIDEQDFSRIFVRGFTTKKEHQGVGLHYCANAMREMSGTIRIESEGLDMGTSVTLLFSRPESGP